MMDDKELRREGTLRIILAAYTGIPMDSPIQLSWHETREEADKAMGEMAETLRRMKLTPRYSVSVERKLRQAPEYNGWAVMLHDSAAEN